MIKKTAETTLNKDQKVPKKRQRLKQQSTHNSTAKKSRKRVREHENETLAL